MKRIITASLVLMAFLTACSQITVSSPPVQTQTARASSNTGAMPIATTPPETQAPSAVIEVRDGDTLERDIIPKLAAGFSIGEDGVKEALAGAKSALIGNAKGFRRMEGIIIPGSYEISGQDIGGWIEERVSEAERRYYAIEGGITRKNALTPSERLTLASIVEADTNLADSYESIVAAVYLNRLDKNDTFGSCPTVEYALGYQRPYLTNEDVKIDSPYNTYKRKGLPPGPICCMDDESLAAAISEACDKKAYFFFYDYVKKRIMAFETYADFKEAGIESKKLFEDTFDISRFEKIDKRAYFAVG